MASAQQPAQPEARMEDGDLGFTGLNELTQPAQLQPAEVSAAKNVRFTNNEATMRLGVAKLPWTNKVTSSSTTPLPFTTIYGAQDFRDPNGVEWMIIAADGWVYRTRENNGASEVPLPPGVTITGPVTFTQGFSGMVMFRGEDLPELLMENVDEGFKPMVQTANTITGEGTENPTNGTEPIPNAKNGEWIGNRMFIPFGKDLLGISDYMNLTRYAGVRSQARINQGSEDALVRMFKFNDNAAIAFKERSVYILSGITLDLSTMALDELTREYGLAAAKSCVNVGKDVWFLAEKRGICSITLTEQNKFQGRDVPVSQNIASLINRINWQYASGAVSAYYDNKFYLAVPLDEAKGYGPDVVRSSSYGVSSGEEGDDQGTAVFNVIPGHTYVWTKGAIDTSLIINNDEILTESGEFVATGTTVALTGLAETQITATLKRVYSGVNNAVLVYDFLQQQWSGHDTGSAIMVQEWIKSTYNGVRRLFALSADGYINLYEELLYDETGYEAFDTILGGTLELYDGPFPNSIFAVTVKPGHRYVYELGINEASITNGSETLTGAGEFVAQGNEVYCNGNAAIPLYAVTATIREVVPAIDAEWIDYDVTLRGYTCGSMARKRFIQAMLELKTWYPQFSVSVISEGVNEEVTVIDDRTKSATRYVRPYNRADWNQTNADDDHATPYREDYAIVLGDDTTASGSIADGVTYYVEDLDHEDASIIYNGNVVTNGETFVGVSGVTTFAINSGTPSVYAPGNYFIPGANGFNPDLHQESTEKFRLPLSTKGKQLQIRLRCTRGRVSLVSAGIEAILADRRSGSYV